MKQKLTSLIHAVKNKIALCWSKLNWLWVAVLFLTILSAGSLICFWIYSEKALDKLTTQILSAPLCALNKSEDNEIPSHHIRRRLDGVYVEPESANIYPVAIIIDNHPDSRPTSGLAQANVVYEAIAEGIVTRFMAIYADGSKVEQIGPVRSARPYFLDWSEGLNALHVHVGGSPEALQKIEDEKIFNLNEFYQGEYFWRSWRRNMPHDVFISAEDINKYLDIFGVKTSADYESWLYKDDALINERPATSTIEIDFSVSNFKVRWEYDKGGNNYLRYIGGEQHKDSDGTLIIAKNIIIIKGQAEVLDELLRRKLTTVGTGKAWYCFDGECEIGKWKKPNVNRREKIYDKWDEEVRFNAGTTWIEVVQSDIEVVLINE